MHDPRVHEIELDLLLEALHRAWGYDFRQYARGSLRRRVEIARQELGAAHLAELQHRLLREPEVFHRIALTLSVPVTELFRNPECYLSLRERVFPTLASYPFLKVWHAGCASGEEVYSLAVLFEEAGLLDRTTFYGTDFNSRALEVARQGIYPWKALSEAEPRYRQAGGSGRLAEHGSQGFDSFRFSQRLRRRMLFSLHNLTVDQVFSEVHLVVCRNVLIYFNRELQARVLELFEEALVPLGFLLLGSREGLGAEGSGLGFEALDGPRRLFRRRAG